MSRKPETHCFLCGKPCDPEDRGSHFWCEQQESARIAASEGFNLSGVSSKPEPDDSHGKAA